MIGRLAFVMAVAVSHLFGADRPTFSVCAAIAKRVEYNGRVIEVRGNVVAGGHGIYLQSSGKCADELVTRGIVWPNVINLVVPNNHSPNIDDHAPFELDRRSIDAADKHALKVGYRAGVDVEVATYIGLFLTHLDLEGRVSPGIADALRLGFGPAGLGAPAQLVIRSIRDVSIVHSGQRWDR